MKTKTGRVDTLATDVQHTLMDMDILYARARAEEGPGGRRIVDSETDEIEAAYKKHRPGAGVLAQSVEVCITGLTAAHGIYSDGFVRKVAPLKRGMNLTVLFPEFDSAA
jgi:hypothetical protein